MRKSNSKIFKRTFLLSCLLLGWIVGFLNIRTSCAAAPEPTKLLTNSSTSVQFVMPESETKKQSEEENASKKTADSKEEKKKAQSKKVAPKATKENSSKKEEPSEKLTLRKIFPKKRKLGTRIEGMAFSHDSKFGAYLFRPVPESRHGADLWIYNTKTGKNRRVTMVSVMAKFQKKTRLVQKDRIKKGKVTLKKEESASKKTADSKEEKKTKKSLATETKAKEIIAAKKCGDWVSKKDSADKKAPRYEGIHEFRWSSVKNELLFTAAGDLYRLVLSENEAGTWTKPTITRLTRTTAAEASARYLPDGSGFTYSVSGVLYKVTFGSSLIEQITPKLSANERISYYLLSPNGKRLAVIAAKEIVKAESHQVEITQFTSRFAKARKVNRSTSESKSSVHEINYYLYDFNDLLNEESELTKVYTFRDDSALDRHNKPSWSKDSNKIVFSTYDEATQRMKIHEAKYPTNAEVQRSLDEEAAIKAAIKLSDEEQKALDKKLAKKTAQEKEEELKEKRKAKLKPISRVVYEFMHNGGPNTTRMTKTYYMADNRRIIFNSEISGFRQLHVVDPVDQYLKQLTHGRFEIYPIRMTKDHKTIFATATKGDPSQLGILKINVEDGKITDLNKTPGFYSSVAVSENGNHVLAIYSTFGKLRDLVHIKVNSEKPMLVLTDSNPEGAEKFRSEIPERFTYKNRHGHTIHGYMFKPDNWNKNDKRPMLLYVYGGPLGTRHIVVDGAYSGSSYLFSYYMAKKHGYVTCTIDPRGMSGYGAMFEKANYKQVGKPQVEDLTDGVYHFIKNYGVDSKRVGIYGWSFGGFQTQMCMYTRPDVFQVGIAGAGPTEWENYNLGYTTATIDKSRTGQTDLKKYSLLPLAKGLQGRLLLVHGMVDSNVLYQDTVNVYRELLKQGKEINVELFLDPTGNHGLGGDIKTYAKYHKYEDFFLRYLGKGKTQTTKKEAPAKAVKVEKSPAENSEPASDKTKLKEETNGTQKTKTEEKKTVEESQKSK